jgi:hypothetical protein
VFRFLDSNVELWNAAADLMDREHPVFFLFSNNFPYNFELILSGNRNISNSLVFYLGEYFSLELELEVLGFDTNILTEKKMRKSISLYNLHPHCNVGAGLSVMGC